MNVKVYVMLIVGFVLLIKGADFFVEASSSVAKMLRVPSIIIGLTIVAFGTSAPELAVSATASCYLTFWSYWDAAAPFMRLKSACDGIFSHPFLLASFCF